jgi:hypothetical protein
VTTEPARRHPVRLTAARKALLRAGFVQSIWPAGNTPQWILTWHDRHHIVRVILGPDRGHQTVITGHHDGTRWHADTEQRHRDHVAAARAGLAQWHRVRTPQRQAAA